MERGQSGLRGVRKMNVLEELVNLLIEVCEYPDSDSEIIIKEHEIFIRIYFRANNQMFISEYKLAELMQMSLQKLREAALQVSCPCILGLFQGDF